jgi:exonuclease III
MVIETDARQKRITDLWKFKAIPAAALVPPTAGVPETAEMDSSGNATGEPRKQAHATKAPAPAPDPAPAVGKRNSAKRERQRTRRQTARALKERAELDRAAAMRQDREILDRTTKLSVLTLNVQGIGTFLGHLRDFMAKTAHAPPDIIVLTETKQTCKNRMLRKLLTPLLHGYSYACTAAPVEKDRGPRAGVLMAVRRAAVPHCTITFSEPADHALRGHYLTALLDGRAHGSLRIIGLYVPCAGSADTDLGASIRAQLEADTIDRDARHTLVAGDMNAAMHPSDRTVGEESPRAYTHDRAHRAAMEGLRLAPVDALPTPDATHARLKTFRRQGKGLISRIDDVLTTVPKEELANMGGEVAVQTHCMEGASTDHDALEVRLPWAALGMEPLQDLPPLPRGPPTKLLKLPMSQEDRG